jgi:beta-alanine--pyruvate transaminase
LGPKRFFTGQPEHGAELADTLERIVALHDAHHRCRNSGACCGLSGRSCAATRLSAAAAQICDTHGILLIFDEVITGFGRTGDTFAAQRFGVRPDIITGAKGLTNGAVPMGMTAVSSEIYRSINAGADALIEFAHGHTYSAHPLVVAAALATVDICRDEGLFERAAQLSPAWERALHSLEGAPHVVDIRNFGLMAAVELAPRAGAAGKRGQEIFHAAYDAGLLIRATGDIIALSPPVIIDELQIDKMVDKLRKFLRNLR